VLVTGGSLGIGFSAVLNFAQRGAKVVFCARNATRALDALDRILSDSRVQEVHKFQYSRTSQIIRRDSGAPVAFIQADISNHNQVKTLVRGAVDRFGTIDIAVNNAGVLGFGGRIVDVPDSMFGTSADVIQVNMYGTLYCMLEELRLWEEESVSSDKPRKEAVIVNIASVEGEGGFPGTSIYSSTKFAIIGLTKSIAGEYASGIHKSGLRVRVNAIAPGPIDTPMVWDSARLWSRGEQEWQGDRILSNRDPLYLKFKKEVLDSKFPGGQIGAPQDIADAIMFLSSEQSAFISGSVLTVDNTLTSTSVKFM